MPRLTTSNVQLLTRSLATVAEELPPALSIEVAAVQSESQRNRERLSDKIFNLTKYSIQEGQPHFRVGENKQYFPKARVILLRPNAKHTPYQAKFIVPKSFNKLDLRDYLYNIYGLRALNVTTQLLPGSFRLSYSSNQRYRSGQVKKMTIDMEDPFIWPSEESLQDTSALEAVEYENERQKYQQEIMNSFGSDRLKPIKAFDGVFKYNHRFVKHTSENFIPKLVGRRLKNDKVSAEQKYKQADDLKLIEKLLKDKQQSSL